MASSSVSSSSPLFILANLTQKIVHSKTGHTFLLYFTVDDDDTCTVDLALPSDTDDAFGKWWWSASWSTMDLREIADLDVVAQHVEEGDLHVRGWSKAKMGRDDLELKLAVGPSDGSLMALALSQCSAKEAAARQKALLVKIAQQAQSHRCRIFPDVPSGGTKEEIASREAELDQLEQQLKKRDRTIDDLKVQLDTANEQLKVYVRDTIPARPTHTFPKIPKGNGKASVTKKRRLVQKVEYED